MPTTDTIERQVIVPEKSPFFHQNVKMLEISYGVHLKSPDPSDNHCECCPKKHLSFILSPGKEIIVRGPILNVYIFIDILFGELGIP